MTRVLIVDDHFAVRAGLKAILTNEPDMLVVAEAEDGEQAIDLFAQHQPDITLIDLRLMRPSSFPTPTGKTPMGLVVR